MSHRSVKIWSLATGGAVALLFALLTLAAVEAEAVGLLAPTAPPAASVNVNIDDPISLLQTAVNAAGGKAWPLAVSCTLLALLWLARHQGRRLWPWLATNKAGAILSGLTALATYAVNAFATGKPLDVRVLGSAVVAGVFAVLAAWPAAPVPAAVIPPVVPESSSQR